MDRRPRGPFSGSSTPTKLRRSIAKGDVADSEDGSLVDADLRPRASMDRLMQKVRPRRSLGRSGRPGSFMESVRGIIGGSDGFEPGLRRAASVATSISTMNETLAEIASEEILKSGEVQIASGFFKSRTQYLVLTKSHLVRVRNHDRASDIFPFIPPPASHKQSGARHTRFGSHDSSIESNNEGVHVMPWTQVVAVQALNDGKSLFSVDLYQFDEERMQALLLVLHFRDVEEQTCWVSILREAVIDERRRNASPMSDEIVTYAARLLELESDYEPSKFRIFCAVQHASKSASRTSDELAKTFSAVCLVALGRFKLHILPLPRAARGGSSSSSLVDMQAKSYGLAALETVARGEDGYFQLCFRIPFQAPTLVSLASICADEILSQLQVAAQSLAGLNSDGAQDDAFCTRLASFCASYGLDLAVFQYREDIDAGRAEFWLLPSDFKPYTVLEIIAVLRALQSCQYFDAIHFSGIDMSPLLSSVDSHQARSSSDTSQSFLGQAFQALLLSSRRLTKLDLSSAFCQAVPDSCSVWPAILPLCPVVRLDWLNMSGNQLGEHDIDHLFNTLSQPSCRFSALDIGQCGLDERNLLNILGACANQSTTIESINISNNSARILPQSLQRELRPFKYLRSLNLSYLSAPIECPDALLDADLLQMWHLKELRLSHCKLSSASVAALALYLRTSQSAGLQFLDVASCCLTGHEIARLFEALGTQPNQKRKISVQISGNRIEDEHESFVTAIRRDQSPSFLTMRSTDYANEEAFERLLDALTRNSTITFLDIAGVSLPGDAQEATSKALGRLMALNTCLTEFDLSGERTHLMASALGIGLQQSFRDLAQNKTLEVLRLQHQMLGSQCIQTLASSLEKNESLKELYMDDNEIDLQALRSLARATEINRTLLYVSSLEADRVSTQSKLIRAFESMQDSGSYNVGRSGPTANSPSGKNNVLRRHFDRSFSGGQSVAPGSNRSSSKGTGADTRIQYAPELQLIIDQFNVDWAREIERIQTHLSRNAALISQSPVQAFHQGLEHKHSSLGSLEAALQAVDYTNGSTGTRNSAVASGQLDLAESDGEDAPLEIGSSRIS